MGHASIQTTYDLYGKLMPGSAAEAAALVDAYLERSNTQGRVRSTPRRPLTGPEGTLARPYRPGMQEL